MNQHHTHVEAVEQGDVLHNAGEVLVQQCVAIKHDDNGFIPVCVDVRG